MPTLLFGVLLFVIGVELYLELGRWPLLVLVAAGLALVGGPRRLGAIQDQVLNLLMAVAFSLYFTITAFHRYRGLSKDLEPTIVNQGIYCARITVTVLLLLGMFSALRAGLERFRTRA